MLSMFESFFYPVSGIYDVFLDEPLEDEPPLGTMQANPLLSSTRLAWSIDVRGDLGTKIEPKYPDPP